MDKNKSTDFEIRAYSKKELALCYFPDLDAKSAGKRLMRWITRNNELIGELKKTDIWIDANPGRLKWQYVDCIGPEVMA